LTVTICVALNNGRNMRLIVAKFTGHSAKICASNECKRVIGSASYRVDLIEIDTIPLALAEVFNHITKSEWPGVGRGLKLKNIGSRPANQIVSTRTANNNVFTISTV
jgi:hypothetical protein